MAILCSKCKLKPSYAENLYSTTSDPFITSESLFVKCFISIVVLLYCCVAVLLCCCIVVVYSDGEELCEHDHIKNISVFFSYFSPTRGEEDCSQSQSAHQLVISEESDTLLA